MQFAQMAMAVLAAQPTLYMPMNWRSPQRVGWTRPPGGRAHRKWRLARASGRR